MKAVKRLSVSGRRIARSQHRQGRVAPADGTCSRNLSPPRSLKFFPESHAIRRRSHGDATTLGRQVSTGRRAFGTKFAIEEVDLTGLNPTEVYKVAVKQKKIRPDYNQEEVLAKLDRIYYQIQDGKKFGDKNGLYIHGPAGTGKSMSMDLFVLACENSVGPRFHAEDKTRMRKIRARRQHFHEFLYETHRLLFSKKLENREKAGNEVIKLISSDIAESCDILCFDEFAITTIQDCVVLTSLFRELWKTDISIVVTSNRHPNNLYEEGLNRYMYLPPFLETLYEKAEVIAIDRGLDYRQDAFQREQQAMEERENLEEEIAAFSEPSYSPGGRKKRATFYSKTESTDAKEFLLEQSLDIQRDLIHTFELDIGYNRKMRLSNCSEDFKAVHLTVKRLFHGPPYFGADDYNAICQHFHTIVLDGLYVLDVADHNEAKRLTNFLDCAYEAHCKLVAINMEVKQAEGIFQNLVPLQSIGVSEIMKRNNSKETAGSGDQDQSAASSGVLEAVRAVRDVVEEQQSNQQSCYYLSEDHKNWSVESKIVGKLGGSGETPSVSAGVSGPSTSKRPSLDEALLQEREGPEDNGVRVIETSGEKCQSPTAPKIIPVTDAGINLRQRYQVDSTPDMKIWKQDEKGMPQVSRAWDDRRRVSQSEWEAADPTAEQHTVKGVFVAAVASLQETGFAVKRAISRMQEMQTQKYQREHRQKHASRGR